MANSILFGRAAAHSGFNRTTRPPVDTAVTMIGWVNIVAKGANQTQNRIFCIGTSAGTSTCGISWDTATTKWGVDNDSALVDGAALTLGTWYHVGFTCAGGGASALKSYVNGAVDVTTTLSPTFTSAKVSVADDGAGTLWANIYVAGLKIYDRVLAIDEINNEMKYLLPVSRAGLNSCYPVLNGWDRLQTDFWYPSAVTRWADFSGNALEWTETGAIDLGPAPPALVCPPINITTKTHIRPLTGTATTDIGIAFRNTTAYVSDGANILPDIGTVAYGYPYVRDLAPYTVVTGWVGSQPDSKVNADNTVDHRLAGYHSWNVGDNGIYQIDLPNTNPIVVHLACGVAGNQFAPVYVRCTNSNGTTVYFTVDVVAGTIVNGDMIDATATEYSITDWPTLETGVAVNPVDSSLRFYVGASLGAVVTFVRANTPPVTSVPLDLMHNTMWLGLIAQ